MASNYIEALDLSSELNEILESTVPIIPTVEWIKNNKSGIDLAYDNYHYHFKQKCRQASNYVCATKGCYASISLAVDTTTNLIKNEPCNKCFKGRKA
jgi:hypothetical protein